MQAPASRAAARTYARYQAKMVTPAAAHTGLSVAKCDSFAGALDTTVERKKKLTSKTCCCSKAAFGAAESELKSWHFESRLAAGNMAGGVRKWTFVNSGQLEVANVCLLLAVGLLEKLELMEKRLLAKW